MFAKYLKQTKYYSFIMKSRSTERRNKGRINTGNKCGDGGGGGGGGGEGGAS